MTKNTLMEILSKAKAAGVFGRSTWQEGTTEAVFLQKASAGTTGSVGSTRGCNPCDFEKDGVLSAEKAPCNFQ